MKKFPRWTLLLPCAAVALVLLLQVMASGPLSVLRNALFDQYQRWHPRPYVEAPVRIIDIDDTSLEQLGQWPWPRNQVANMVDRLTAAGVAAIGFDVMFSETDRTSPQVISQHWPLDAATREKLLALPNHDQILAESLKNADAVLGFALERTPSSDKLPARKAAFVNLGEAQTGWLHPFGGAIPSLAVLEATAKGNGALSFVPDSDGVVRRVPLVLRLNDEPASTLVSESLRLALGGPIITLRSAGHQNGMTGPRDNGGLGEIRIADMSIPTTANGEIWVHYTQPMKERSLPAWQIFSPEHDLSALEGQIVLIGSSAQGLMDLRFSPFGLMPGVEAHAQALEQILTEHYLQRPSWTRALEAGLLIAGGLLVGVLALRTRALIAALACLVVVSGMAAYSWQAFVSDKTLIDVSLPILAVLFSFIACSLAHHFLSEREQRWVKEAFARYVSPNRVNHLLENQDAMALGGKRQQCSFIFTDLAGFTSLMEGIDPGEAVALLNDYLDEMISIAFRHDGTLDRIVGDAVAIMFSAPIEQSDFRERALACALEMDAYASAYAKNLQDKGIPFGKTRIGVHAGEVIVGNFGGKTIFDYRALGDPVNTAARLESANKHLGTRVCVSEAILGDTQPANMRPIGKLVVKGKTRALGVFEPVNPDALEGRAPVDVYMTAYSAMAEQAPDATQRIAQLAAAYPDDGLLALHQKRMQSGQTGDLIVLSEK